MRALTIEENFPLEGYTYEIVIPAELHKIIVIETSNKNTTFKHVLDFDIRFVNRITKGMEGYKKPVETPYCYLSILGRKVKCRNEVVPDYFSYKWDEFFKLPKDEVAIISDIKLAALKHIVDRYHITFPEQEKQMTPKYVKQVAQNISITNMCY